MSTDYTELLHRPGRAEHMETLEQHLNEAAELAHAVWIAAGSEGAFACKRDRDAFQRLASVLADHATAALVRFYQEDADETDAPPCPSFAAAQDFELAKAHFLAATAECSRVAAPGPITAEMKAAEDRQRAAQEGINAAARALYQTAPAAPHGAIALLSVVVDEIEASEVAHALHGGKHMIGAMRRALEVLEREIA